MNPLRHLPKLFHALLALCALCALCALALPRAARIQRDTRASQPPLPRQTGTRAKRVTLGGSAVGVAALPRRSPLSRVGALAPLSQSAQSLANELHDMINRAFASANLSQPSAAQSDHWKAQAKSEQLTYKRLVEILRKARPRSTGTSKASV